MLFLVKDCWTLSMEWAGALVIHPSWNGQTCWKQNSLRLNSASPNNTSWYIDTDGFLEHKPSGESLYYQGPALQKILPFLCVSPLIFCKIKEMDRGDVSPVHSILKFFNCFTKSCVRKHAIRTLIFVSTLNLHTFKTDVFWWIVYTFFFKKIRFSWLVCEDFTRCFSLENNCLLIPPAFFFLQANRAFQEL